MARRTWDGIETDLKHIGKTIDEIKVWQSEHGRHDEERFEAQTEKYNEIVRMVGELKLMLTDTLKFADRIEDSEREISKLKLTGAKNQPWMEIVKSLLRNMIYAVIGGGAVALWEMLRK